MTGSALTTLRYRVGWLREPPRPADPSEALLYSSLQQRAATRWRVFAGIFLVYLAYLVPDLWRAPWPRRALGLLVLVGFVVVYLARPVRQGDEVRHQLGVVAVLAACTLAETLLIGPAGLVLATYLAVTIGTVLPLRWAAPLVLAIFLVVLFLPPAVPDWHVKGLPLGLAGPSLLAGGCAVIGRLAWTNHRELTAAHAEISRLAAEQERLRIARDLHDLLGHALTGVVVKAELASRLVERDPPRAAAEIAQVAALARQGLEDVRAAVSGYREVNLTVELATARQVLESAGIRLEADGVVDALPTVDPRLRELFAWVIREGVTNVLRHSGAGRVWIELTSDCVSVRDDGRGCPGPTQERDGHGLDGLRERAASVGAQLVATSNPDGGFVLTVQARPVEATRR